MDCVDELILMCSHPIPFRIPAMRFVKTGLAVATDNRPHGAYIIEEVISEDTEGKFTKYIGNNSAKPIPHLNDDVMHRAQFLTFCQHVQYLKTKGLALVADFQGAYT